MNKRKVVLAIAVGTAVAAMGATAPAQAQELKATISGQVNRAMMQADDGVQSDTFFVDNDNSSTRFRFVGTANVAPGLKAGILWEVEFQGNDSDLVNMTGTPTTATSGRGSVSGRDTGSPTFQERHTAVFVEGGWGKVMLGQTDGAGNGAVEVDLSGTSVAHYSGAADIGGSLQFRTSAGAFSGVNINASSSQQDFESRYDLVRYDTPNFNGFKVAGSVGTKSSADVKEIALWYSGKIAGFGDLAGAFAFSQKDVGASGEDEIMGGSISWLHGSGFNLTFGRTEREVTGVSTDRKFTYGKVGYKTGKHAFSVDFGRGEDQAAAGDEADFYGIGYVWTPVSWAEFYGLIKRHTLDRPGASFQDIDVFMIGSRLKF